MEVPHHFTGRAIRHRAPYLGIVNPGSLCYMTSILQQIHMMDGLRESILELHHRSQELIGNGQLDGPTAAVCNFLSLLVIIFTLIRDPPRLATQDLSDRILDLWDLMNGGEEGCSVDQQKDASECFSDVINRINAAFTLLQSNAPSLSRAYLEGRTSTRGELVHCFSADEGRRKMERVEIFNYIPLDVNGEHIQSIPDAILDWMKVEKFTFRWPAGSGKEKSNAVNLETEKSVKFKRLPKYLTFQLRRFGFDVHRMQKTKKHDWVSFNDWIDMTPYMQPGAHPRSALPTNSKLPADKVSTGNASVAISPRIYRLTGCVVHRGRSANKGHYYSFARDSWSSQVGVSSAHDSGTADAESPFVGSAAALPPGASRHASRWWRFDDEAVTASDLAEVHREAFGGAPWSRDGDGWQSSQTSKLKVPPIDSESQDGSGGEDDSSDCGEGGSSDYTKETAAGTAGTGHRRAVPRSALMVLYERVEDADLLLLTNMRLLTAAGEVLLGKALLIAEGVIVKVLDECGLSLETPPSSTSHSSEDREKDAPVEKESVLEGVRRVDLCGCYCGPGLIDLQVYGSGGMLFGDRPRAQTLRQMEVDLCVQGTTGFLVAMATNTLEVLHEGLRVAREYCGSSSSSPARGNCWGVHLEGPYLSPERRGAHPADLIRTAALAEVREMLLLGGTALRMMTVAPERVGRDVMALLHRCGVVLSAGHSNATYAEAKGFLQGAECKPNRSSGISSSSNCAGAGAEDSQSPLVPLVSAVTHLFNAMPPMLHREPFLGFMPAVFEQRPFTSIVADGVHVHFAMVRLAKRELRDRLFLITDAVTDTQQGIYQHQIKSKALPLDAGSTSSLRRSDDGNSSGSSGDNNSTSSSSNSNNSKTMKQGDSNADLVDKGCGVEGSEDDECAEFYAMPDGTLSGSALTLLQAVRNCVTRCGVPLPEAVNMASLYPAQLLGLDKPPSTGSSSFPDRGGALEPGRCFGLKGKVEVGYDADLCVFNDQFEVMATFLRGEQVFSRLHSGEKLE